MTSTAAEYALLAETYDRRWRAYIEGSIRETVARTDLNPDDKILDIGTGTGALVNALLEKSPTIESTGVDPSPEMLAHAKTKLKNRATLIVAPAEHLPFENEEFDAIVSSSSLHFWEDKTKGLAETHRVLKPGGRLTLTDWCADDLIMRIRDGYLKITRNQSPALTTDALRSALKTSGFDIRRIDRYRISWNWALMTALATKPIRSRP